MVLTHGPDAVADEFHVWWDLAVVELDFSCLVVELARIDDGAVVWAELHLEVEVSAVNVSFVTDSGLHDTHRLSLECGKIIEVDSSNLHRNQGVAVVDESLAQEIGCGADAQQVQRRVERHQSSIVRIGVLCVIDQMLGVVVTEDDFKFLHSRLSDSR